MRGKHPEEELWISWILGWGFFHDPRGPKEFLTRNPKLNDFELSGARFCR
jgi:hypothetical protein